MKKAFVGLAVGLSLVFSFPALAGWTEIYTDEGVCEAYQNEDGTYKANEWYLDENEIYHYFYDNGAMAVNTITPDGYYVDANGCYLPTGTQSERTGWYHYTHYNSYSNLSFLRAEESDIDGGSLWLEEGEWAGLNAIFYEGDEIYEIDYFSPRLDETYAGSAGSMIYSLEFDGDSIILTETTYISGTSYMTTEKTYTR